MIQLIKKGGLRERANRSQHYTGSENTEATLRPNRYNSTRQKNEETSETSPSIPNKNPTPLKEAE